MPQDPVYHAEGDVFTHVSLVCRRLSELEEYQTLKEDEKQILAWAAALHDMAKPACTIRESDGRISSPLTPPKARLWHAHSCGPWTVPSLSEKRSAVSSTTI